MKTKSLLTVLITFYSLLSYAQIPFNANHRSHNLVENSDVLGNYPSGVQPGARGGTIQFQLDYSAADNALATSIGSDFFFTGYRLNSSFDDNDTMTLNWAVVKFDTFHDYSTGTGYVRGQSTITIDTIYIGIAHGNLSGQNDTIQISVLQLAGASGITLNGTQTTATNTTNTVLYTDQIITNNSISPFPSINLLTFPIAGGLTMPQGEGFAVKLDFFAPETDTLYAISGWRDDCFSACVASPTSFSGNSWYRQNWWLGPNLVPPNGFNVSGINNPFGVYYDCNSNQQFEPAACEDLQIQNFMIWASVRINDSTASTCLAPNNLWTNPITPNAARVNWNSSPNAHHYRLRGRQVGGTTWKKQVIHPGWPTLYNFTGVFNYTDHEWQVQAFCDSAETDSSGWSNLETFRTGCQTPQNLRVPVSSSVGTRLAWDEVEGATNYVVKGKRVGTALWFPYNVTTSYLDITNMPLGFQFEWTVRAWCDTVGLSKSPWATLHTFTSGAGPQKTGISLEPGMHAFGVMENLFLNIYPNPTTDLLTISIPSTEETEVKVWSATGKLIVDNQEPDCPLRLSTVNWPKGIYLVEVVADGHNHRQKIVKQ